MNMRLSLMQGAPLTFSERYIRNPLVALVVIAYPIFAEKGLVDYFNIDPIFALLAAVFGWWVIACLLPVTPFLTRLMRTDAWSLHDRPEQKKPRRSGAELAVNNAGRHAPRGPRAVNRAECPRISPRASQAIKSRFTISCVSV